MFVKKEINRRSLTTKQEPGFLGRESEFCLDKVIPDYTTDLVTSYKLVQKNGLPVKLIAKAHKMPEIIDFSSLIKNLNHPIKNLQSIKDFFLSQIDSQEFLVFLFDQPEPQKLIANNLGFFKGKAEVILQQIAIPLLEIVNQLHNQDLSHNNINLKNLWVEIEEGQLTQITLSNSFLELPGYYQTHTFEERTRNIMHRAGKAYKKEADNYAIGLLILSLFSGNSSLKGSFETIHHNKIQKGSYKTALDDWFGGDSNSIPTSLKIVAYWLLQDNLDKRWSANQALKFLRRRHKKIALNYWNKKTNQDQASSHNFSLELNGIVCKSRTEAANLGINYYEEIKVKVKNGKLIKNLINNPQIKPNFISDISYLRNLAATSNNSFLTKDEIFLTFFILALEKNMPLKLRELSFDPRALSSFLIYLASKENNQNLHHLLKIILSNLFDTLYKGLSFLGFDDLAKLPKIPLELISNYSNIVIKEFVIALVNPYAIFRSPLLDNKIFFTTRDLLVLLNELPADKLEEALDNERIIVWLKAKYFIKNGFIKDNKLDIIADLQEEALPNLGKFFLNKLDQNKIAKNLVLRAEKLIQLTKAANSGDLRLFTELLSDKSFYKDKKDFLRIKVKRNQLEAKLILCQEALQDKKSFLLAGEKLTKRFAGSFLLIFLLHLSYKLFWLE
jgi:hypothetical protein